MAKIYTNDKHYYDIANAIRKISNDNNVTLLSKSMMEMAKYNKNIHTVNFFDYNGECVYAIPAYDIDKMTDLPVLPKRDGMKCMGWSHTLEHIKEYKPCAVIALYEVTCTQIGVQVTDDIINTPVVINLTQSEANSTVISWGDNSQQVIVNMSESVTHNYMSVGFYNISITSNANYSIDGVICSHCKDLQYDGVSLGVNAFANCTKLNSVMFSNNVKTISDYTFANCNIKTVYLPESIESIGNNVFAKNNSITAVCVNCKSVGNGMFFDTGLKNLSLSVNTNNIGDNAFANCMIKRIKLNDVARNFGSNAFTNNPIKEIGVHDDSILCDNVFAGCTQISEVNTNCVGNGMFYNCGGLKKARVKNINAVNNLFRYCNYLNDVEIDEDYDKIPDGLFNGCNDLNVTKFIHNDLTYIGDWSLPPMTDIKEFTVPNGVNVICDGVLNGCYNLQNVKIHNGVTTIGSYAFSNCYNLASIEIPNSITSIGDGVFQSCHNLTSIEIPNSVTTIGNNTFRNCDNLATIKIPNSVTRIGYYAFWDCSNLTSIEIPNSVANVGNYAFCNCNNLSDVVISENVVNIGNNAFKNCNIINYTDYRPIVNNDIYNKGYANRSSLKKVILGNSVINISANVFQNCSNLSDVVIGENVVNIGNNAFKNCNIVNYTDYRPVVTNTVFYDYSNNASKMYLQKVIIGNNTVTIGNYTFYGCSNLTSIEIPNSVTTIGNSAFYNCNNLTSIEIPNSVTTIGNYTFYNCSNLKSVNIPNNVQTIGNNAFEYCWSLTSIEIPNSVVTIGNSAFWGCHNLTSINVFRCEQIPAIYDDTFAHVNKVSCKLYVNSSMYSNWINSAWNVFTIVNV